MLHPMSGSWVSSAGVIGGLRTFLPTSAKKKSKQTRESRTSRAYVDGQCTTRPPLHQCRFSQIHRIEINGREYRVQNGGLQEEAEAGMLIGQKPSQALMGTTSLEHRACAAPWQGEMSTGFTVQRVRTLRLDERDNFNEKLLFLHHCEIAHELIVLNCVSVLTIV